MSCSRLGRLNSQHSALLVCDVQERFKTVIQQFEAVVDTSKRMVKGAELLQIPVVVSEQYPKALVLLVGIEAHVCVFQTTLDLLVPVAAEQGMEVHLVTDGISSSRLADRAIALQHPAFKGVSALAKEQRPTQLPALHSNL
eukprot:jgi/Astpho2/6615/Aster-04982